MIGCTEVKSKDLKVVSVYPALTRKEALNLYTTSMLAGCYRDSSYRIVL